MGKKVCGQVSARGDTLRCSLRHTNLQGVHSYITKFETLGFSQCLV